MLVLTRHLNEEIVIEAGGETIRIMVVDLNRARVRLGFEASPSVSINRREIHIQKKAQQERANDGAKPPPEIRPSTKAG